MHADITIEEEMETLRCDIVALLSKDPHHPYAQILGQRLMDLQIELYERD